MNFVTIYYIWLKCYLYLCRIVAAKMRSITPLAIAFDDLYSFFEKNIKNIYCFLFTVQTSLLSSTVTNQDILSLSDSSSACTISTGTVVRSDFECAVCKFTVDSNSNNFMSPFMLFLVNIFDNIL